MAGLCWTAVVLVLLLSTENNVSANLDINGITTVVDFLMTTYGINTQVGVAANIPQNQDLKKLQDVFPEAEIVGKELRSKERLYVGDTMVAALPRENVHAEVRVLKNMNTLVGKAKAHFLVFYTFNSPCDRHCMKEGGKFSIIPKIKAVFPNWTQFAFVFSKAYDTPEGTGEALKQLGNTIGHNNVFRCYKPENEAFKCINCFTGKQHKELVDQCTKN